MEKHVTTSEAAAVIGCNTSRVRQLLLAGKLRGERVGRDWLVERKSAEEYRDTERKPGRKAAEKKPAAKPKKGKAKPG